VEVGQHPPAFYWAPQGVNWTYVSSTGNTRATVSPDGALVGKTRTRVGRMGCHSQKWQMGDDIPAAAGKTTDSCRRWAAAAETLEDLTVREAAFALAMGAPEWCEWNG
jgi:hypothetical protein